MEKYWKRSIFIILIPTPDFPQFYYMLGGNLGSLLYGDVSVMITLVGEERANVSAIGRSCVASSGKNGYANWVLLSLNKDITYLFTHLLAGHTDCYFTYVLEY